MPGKSARPLSRERLIGSDGRGSWNRGASADVVSDGNFPNPVMKLWKIVAAGWLIGAVAIAAQAQDARFSKTLTSAELADTGIAKLSPDQLAVLDALIRRDAKIIAVPDAEHPAPPRFTLRQLPEERARAGLGSLTEAELSRLDALVADFESGRRPAPAPAGPDAGWKPIVNRPRPEVHGMVSLTYGAGSGGYQEMGGAMVVNVDDPEHGLSLWFGYATMRVKGPFLNGGCYPGILAQPRQ